MDEIFIVSTTINKSGASHCAVMLSKNISNPKIALYSLIFDIEFSTEDTTNVIQLSTSHSSKNICRFFIYVNNFTIYMSHLHSKKPRLSMSINSLSHIFNLLACAITRTKCIIAVHDNPLYYTSTLGKLVKSTSIILARILEANIITVSNGLKKVLVDKYCIPEASVSVIHNPIDLDDIVTKSLEPLITPLFQDVPVIIAVGNVIPVKGHWHLLRVFDKVCDFIPCKLVICGDTTRDKSYMQYLSSIHNNMEHKENVMFTGWTENPYKYIKNSTVFVLPSLSEGLPYCLIEALACGCPVVASNCVEGVREILNDGEYGLLCEKLDEIRYSAGDSLTDAEIDMMEKILYLLENPEVRQEFTRKGIERAKDFDKNIFVEKYIEYFEECLD